MCAEGHLGTTIAGTGMEGQLFWGEGARGGVLMSCMAVVGGSGGELRVISFVLVEQRCVPALTF